MYAWLLPLFLNDDFAIQPNENFDIGSFIDALTSSGKSIFSGVVILIGLLMVFVGIWQIAKGFLSAGKGQTNWLMAIGCLIIGGLLAFSGYETIVNMAAGASQTITNLGEPSGGNVILPFLPF